MLIGHIPPDILRSVRFELTRISPVDLESTALDHSAKNAEVLNTKLHKFSNKCEKFLLL